MSTNDLESLLNPKPPSTFGSNPTSPMRGTKAAALEEKIWMRQRNNIATGRGPAPVGQRKTKDRTEKPIAKSSESTSMAYATVLLHLSVAQTHKRKIMPPPEDKDSDGMDDGTEKHTRTSHKRGAIASEDEDSEVITEEHTVKGNRQTRKKRTISSSNEDVDGKESAREVAGKRRAGAVFVPNNEPDEPYDAEPAENDSDNGNFNEDEDDKVENESDTFEVEGNNLEEERAVVVGKKTKGRRGDGRGRSYNNDDQFILPADLDGQSDSSSIDLSMVTPDNDGHENAVVKPIRGQAARNAKYQSERPTVVPSKARVEPRGKYTKPISVYSDPNEGWSEITHLVYPNQARTISLRIQTQHIQRVLREAIPLAIGLAVFQNAFASSDKQLADSKNSLLTGIQKLGHVQIADRLERDIQYAKHLTNYVTGRVGSMRGNVKEVAVDVVKSHYGILQVPVENDQRKKFVDHLLHRSNFIFPRTTLLDPTSARANEPYRHPAITSVLHKYFFNDKAALGYRFSQTFKSSVENDDAKEIPRPMLALVTVAIFAALQEWKDGQAEPVSKSFESASYSDEYENHITLLRTKILKMDGSGKGKYHALMARLYSDALKGNGIAKGKPSEMPDIDFDGMSE
ncbi:hypothetical protein DFJ43DRAFT_1161260 [Lentinula guzmanii]|uniref:DUF6532 domain-containing protein n=1 Tax=Lentinula guzmanii TaxID=2804957 RepID=A0AA38J904_9AGAR|nr:hypothetical protein DFJ43DRAFT_1161260 [Lentinula guzmanii]